MKCVVTRWIAVVAMLFATAVCLAQYSVTYSGGSCSVTNGSPGGPYTLSNGRYGGGGTGASASCSGTITATFTWTGASGTAPSNAVVMQSCSASSWAYSGAASSANGLGDSPVTSFTSIPPYFASDSGDGSSGPIAHYSVVSGGQSFTVTCSPSASSSGSAANAGVSYQASAAALSIHFTDTNGTGSDSTRQYLIGQNVQAQVSSGSLPVSGTPTWTTSGGSPFASYVRSKSSAVLNPLPSPDATTTFSGYYALEGTPTLSCSGILTTPSGAQPTGGLSFTLSQMLQSVRPNFSDFEEHGGTQGGYPQPNPGSLYCFGLQYTDPDLPSNPQNCGMYVGAKLVDSSGQFYYVQLVTLSRGRSNGSTTQTLGDPLGTNPETYAVAGLDTLFPAAPSSDTGYFPTGTHYDNDGPGQDFEEPANWSSYSISTESFQLYLMYKPPGTNSMDVPCESWTWSWSCSGTKDGHGVWTAPDSPLTIGVHQLCHVHPVWQRCITAFGAVWHS